MSARTGRGRRALRVRAVRAGALLAAGLVAAGCGIPTTGVVEAGEPASGIRSVTTLYFVLPNDALAVRRIETGGLNGVGPSVALLLKGLGPGDAKTMGLSTRLPLPTQAPDIRTAAGRVDVDLHAAAPRLSPVAVDQVVCTAAAAYREAGDAGTGPVRVTVALDGRPQAGSADQPTVCARAATSWPFAPAGPPAATYPPRPR